VAALRAASYQLSDAQNFPTTCRHSSYYTTHYFPERAVELALSLGAHRKLFSYLTMFVEGAGTCRDQLHRFTEPRAVAAAAPLSSPSTKISAAH